MHKEIIRLISIFYIFFFGLIIFYIGVLHDKRRSTIGEKSKEKKIRTISAIIYFAIIVIGPLILTLILRYTELRNLFDNEGIIWLIILIIFLSFLWIFYKKAEGGLLLAGYVFSILMLISLIITVLYQFEKIVYWSLACFLLAASFYVVSSGYLLLKKK